MKPYAGNLDHSNARHALRRTMVLAADELPADWLPIIKREAQAARPAKVGRQSALEPEIDTFAGHATDNVYLQRDVWRGYLAEFGGSAAAQLTDADIKAIARRTAREASDLDIGLQLSGGAWHEYGRLFDFCTGREVAPPPPGLLLSGMGARVRCQYWWRRALRKMVARKCERGYLAMGLVCKTNGQPYASNKAVLRRVDQNQRNREALENIVFENDEGYRRTLAELAAASVSNKAIRRGELMTRIRGCEALADELGHAGLFVTLTAPSRFHSTLRHGARNPKYDGSTPREAQDWHCLMWARARAKLARRGVNLYGFRVAEPHHDGCTHWHMLVWFGDSVDSRGWDERLKFGPVLPTYDVVIPPLNEFQRVVRAYWLSDGGDEKGAQKYRVAFKVMEQGGAAGYIAKYISKNIDDHGIDSHLDDYAEGEIGPDLIGDLEIKPSLRVEAWASNWGIRQFQPLGQPPVTVWRELRRVGEAQARAAGFNGVVHKAWLAAQRVGGILADWARYVKAQGGLMLGRACRVVMRHDVQEIAGTYGTAARPVPVGVALNLPGSRTVWSERRCWRAVDVPAPAPASALGKRSAPARTRVNNCTVDDREALALDAARGSGGADFRGSEGKLQPERFDHAKSSSKEDPYDGASSAW